MSEQSKAQAKLATCAARLALVQVAAIEATSWRKRRDTQVVAAHAGGCSLREIAEAAGMTVGGVQAILGRA